MQLEFSVPLFPSFWADPPVKISRNIGGLSYLSSKRSTNSPDQFQVAKKLISLVKDVDEQTIVIDGGCYVGAFSKNIARVFHSPSILAFEPDPDSFDIAKKKFLSDRRIEIVNAALGAQMGHAEFFRGPYSATNSLLPRPSGGLKPYFPEQASLEGGTSVEVVTLDHECGTRGIELIWR